MRKALFLKPGTLALAFGLLIGTLLARRTTEHFTSQETPSSALPMPDRAPRYARILKRYALVDLATLIGIPLALLALFLSTRAAQDAARQVESAQEQIQLTRLQVQPTFRVRSKERRVRQDSETEWIAYDRLSVTMSGNANDVGVTVTAAFVMRRGDHWIFSPVPNWWTSTGHSEMGPWASNPKLLIPLTKDKTIVGGAQLITYVVPGYNDMFDEFHQVYFRVDQVFSGKYFIAGPLSRRESEEEAMKCASLFEAPEENGATGRLIPLDATHPLTVRALVEASYVSPFPLDMCAAN